MQRDGTCLAGTSKGDIAIVVGTVIMQVINAPFKSLKAWGSREAYELATAPNGITGMLQIHHVHSQMTLVCLKAWLCH